jgi:hypothetical protein
MVYFLNYHSIPSFVCTGKIPNNGPSCFLSNKSFQNYNYLIAVKCTIVTGHVNLPKKDSSHLAITCTSLF